MKKSTYLHHKLRSRKGASIVLALFLFLVCVVIGSVVLTAGTAAAGRRAQIEQADSRYYAVNSAAELFHTVIPGETVALERVKTVESTYTIHLNRMNMATAKGRMEIRRRTTQILYTASNG